MLNKIKTYIQFLLPQHLLSRIFGKVANSHIKWLKNLLIRWAIKTYKIDMTLAHKESIDDYESFNAFFIRELKKTVRPIAQDDDVIVSPVDGFISQLGHLKQDRLLQAKGKTYGLAALLGSQACSYNKHFVDGSFITLYLTPRDYHRIHMPIAGKLLQSIYIPGKLFSVDRTGVKCIHNLFARNERVVSIFETNVGYMAVVMVGAIFVASIHTAWKGIVVPNSSHLIQTDHYEDKNITYKKGDEIGYFEFGSTVIVLFEKDKMRLLKGLNIDQAVCFGQKIGRN